MKNHVLVSSDLSLAVTKEEYARIKELFRELRVGTVRNRHVEKRDFIDFFCGVREAS